MNYQLLALPVLAILVIGFFKLWKEHEKNEQMNPFQALDEASLCAWGHTWGKASFINPDGEVSVKTYCEKCGLLPQHELQVKSAFLTDMANQRKEIEARTQRIKDVHSLETEFFEHYVEASAYKNQRDRILLAEGFLVYKNFVEHLPELLAAKDAGRKLTNSEAS